MELHDKVALVTGGTKGIGAATAIAFAQSGANVAIVGRHHDNEAVQVLAAIERLGRRGAFVQADCGNADQATACVAAAAQQFGPVDVLVHSAGGPVNGGLFDVTPEMWLDAFNVHVHAIFHLCRAAIPAMRINKEGAIVLVSSTAGIRGVSTNVAYQTVKGALPQLTRALAREFADDNIRVNCVAPGIIRTRFHDQMTEETKRNNLQNRVPLHREGTSEQVASVIRELATNDYITGQTVVIDGGLTMRIA
jgi:NAD(P)-dependent dehydrogenase (short-subunit alcohol dehydrogenase family)